MLIFKCTNTRTPNRHGETSTDGLAFLRMTLPHAGEPCGFGGALLAGDGLTDGGGLGCLFGAKGYQCRALLAARYRHHNGGNLHREFAVYGCEQARAPRRKFPHDAGAFGGNLARVRTAQCGQCHGTRNP